MDAAQNTIGWYRARLGMITGSAVGNLMGSGRGGNPFSATAESYMQQLAFERAMSPDIVADDELFGAYISVTEVHSKAMEWGHKQEDNAAQLFAAMFSETYEPQAEPFTPEMQAPPSVRHKTIPHFASSPDRMFTDTATGETCCLEIKSPQGKAFSKYASIITLPTEAERLEALKKAEPNYYWQLFSHMMVTGTTTCYWAVYNPFCRVPLFSMPIHWDEEVTRQIEERVRMADERIESLAALMK